MSGDLLVKIISGIVVANMNTKVLNRAFPLIIAGVGFVEPNKKRHSRVDSGGIGSGNNIVITNFSMRSGFGLTIPAIGQVDVIVSVDTASVSFREVLITVNGGVCGA